MREHAEQATQFLQCLYETLKNLANDLVVVERNCKTASRQQRQFFIVLLLLQQKKLVAFKANRPTLPWQHTILSIFPLEELQPKIFHATHTDFSLLPPIQQRKQQQKQLYCKTDEGYYIYLCVRILDKTLPSHDIEKNYIWVSIKTDWLASSTAYFPGKVLAHSIAFAVAWFNRHSACWQLHSYCGWFG